MRIETSSLLLFLSLYQNNDGTADAFSILPRSVASPFSVGSSDNTDFSSSSALYGKRRQTKRKKKQSQGRSKEFYDAIDDAKGKAVLETEPEEASSSSTTATATDTASPQDKAREEAMQDAQKRYEQRPEVSTMIVDESTGTEMLAQGQKVMDVVTRNAVKLSNLGADARLAQMFPGVTPEVREKYRVDWRTAEVPEMIEQLKDACMVDLGDGTRGIPPHPSISNKGLDYVLANRDRLGYRMKKTIGRWTFHAASQGNIGEAKEVWNKLHKNFLTMENYISGPFRQIMQDAEGRVGPNFGNLELMSFCDGDLYERVGNYLVLKGMVAHWEKKVVDADFFENQRENEYNQLRGDPKRFLRDAPILFTLKECTQVCAMAQQMCQLFVEEEKLFVDFPPEIVFLEDSLKIKGGTALRKYMIDEFCPARGITPEGLREGIRRLYQQLENMQVDPYADLTMKVEQLYAAMSVGTDDARDPYLQYLSSEASQDPRNPAYFETYTFNYPKQSMVRFLDNTYPSTGGISQLIGPPPTKAETPEGESDAGSPFDGLSAGFNNLIGQIKGERNLRVEPTLVDDNSPYTVPKERAIGREHDLGWFEELNVVTEKSKLGEMAPGRIIKEE
mmetsp:Transcript_21908/g.52125  ORF Transcript_21908/g.52125 Transcript_21908/m.52125 type:complete len:618 (-) Transcript_21908:125-1978(-)|eukprot:CAMPEP_0197175806 /NCGR_PEP_ID=MMETSP1423-20130617/1928_1 /TAXON_ID=476441 /ORGANISM="Pseudo-nitzschia heimii, Strain UNC1101" /LENGTH=617 /DNA_ID=CAMNT_0042625053 /DNA_START=64 /DNA_END=1917 /DNA_ORIENTATION=+